MFAKNKPQVLARLLPAVYNKLRKRAKENKRSLGSEAAAIIEKEVAKSK